MGGTDLNAMAVNQIKNSLSAGQRVKCVATQSQPEGVTFSSTYTIYLTGDKQATDSTIQSEGSVASFKSYTDFKTKTVAVYMGSQSTGEVNECDWLKMTTTYEDPAGQRIDESQPFESAVSTQFPEYTASCAYDNFDDSVFTEPTVKVCDLAATPTDTGTG